MTKSKHIKTKSDRLSEVLHVIKQLNEFGLNDNHEDIKKFTDILKQFVNDGIYQKGRINVTGTKRQINYILPEYKGNSINIKLKYIEYV